MKIDIRKEVRKFLEENKLYNSKILLAVSGGRDSVALLDVCFSLKEEFNIEFIVAHFDHNLRDSSESDAESVKKLSKKYDLKCYIKKAQNKPLSENIEAWAREKRYEFLKKILKEEKADYIFTAHTGSDVAETLLMKLVSNKEPRGIYKIDEKRHLMRPFLSVLRDDIDSYVKEHKLTYVDDPTNVDTKYLRNKVRHMLIPFLKENFNENIEKFLSYRGVSLEDDFKTLYNIAQGELDKLSGVEKYSKIWLRNLKNLMVPLSESIKWRMAELVVKDEIHFNIGKKTSLEIVDLFFSKRVAVNLPESKRMVRSKGKISFELKSM